jgi:hypothetical protein
LFSLTVGFSIVLSWDVTGLSAELRVSVVSSAVVESVSPFFKVDVESTELTGAINWSCENVVNDSTSDKKRDIFNMFFLSE